MMRIVHSRVTGERRAVTKLRRSGSGADHEKVDRSESVQMVL
jgi:hypothetical protein